MLESLCYSIALIELIQYLSGCFFFAEKGFDKNPKNMNPVICVKKRVHLYQYDTVNWLELNESSKRMEEARSRNESFRNQRMK